MKNLFFLRVLSRGRTVRLASVLALSALGHFAAQAQYCTGLGGQCGTGDIGTVGIVGTTFAPQTICVSFPGSTNADFTYAPPPTNPASFTATLPSGVTYTIGTGGARVVWIDYNRNGTFDANEGAVASGGTATITIPATAVPGATGIRFRSGVPSVNDACTFSGFGESKTFTVTIGAPVACPAASGVAVGSITNTSASLNFTPGSAATTSYTVTLTPQGGTGTPVTPAPTASPVALPNLVPGTMYTVRLVGNCAGGPSTPATLTFTTTGVRPCIAPTGLAATNVTANSASLTFTAAAGTPPTNYTVTLTPATGNPVTLTGTASPIALPNLTPNTAYTVGLVANCTATNMAPAVTTTFSTPLPTCLPVGTPQVTVTSSTTGVLDFGPVLVAGSYTITLTPAGGTPIILTATTNPVQLTGLTPRTNYTVSIVSNCMGTATPTSTAATTTFATPGGPCASPAFVVVNGTTPYLADFEAAWQSVCDVRDAPGAGWRNTPRIGEASWRRNDDGVAANWANPTTGAYAPTGSNIAPASTHSARNHTSDNSFGNAGSLDLFVNLAGNTLAGVLSYHYLNTSGDDSLYVQFSTNGGTSFAAPVARLNRSPAWTARNIPLATSLTATTVIRFRAISGTSGGTDIGLDNVRLTYPRMTGTASALAAQLTLAPNPARQRATLTIPAGVLAGAATATLCNSLGQVLLVRDVPAAAAGAVLDLPLTGLAAGLYSVQVKAAEGIATKRLVVE